MATSLALALAVSAATTSPALRPQATSAFEHHPRTRHRYVSLPSTPRASETQFIHPAASSENPPHLSSFFVAQDVPRQAKKPIAERLGRPANGDDIDYIECRYSAIKAFLTPDGEVGDIFPESDPGNTVTITERKFVNVQALQVKLLLLLGRPEFMHR
ncbi:hypothetical protein K432DRAFT_397944 [Lepidopterella palustris CBS 459.81]|uniref:Uncharacterized protein n=1 Tax=Lepidopterella palustris CBS 459.81 TaxID=1314670 RepID=A0A8E2DZT6_9PEZI|nr:hypothetical protein K432DRAFT_397944 [Lepidopterella palustris CBS 459.81]